METASRELGVDPAELRRKNFITTFPHQTPVIMNYDAGDYAASLDMALKAVDYAGFKQRKAEAAKRGKLRGIGFSSWIEACGIAPSAAVGSLGAGVGLWESAEVRVNPVGTIEVLTGAHCPRPGPRDDLRPDHQRPARHRHRQHLDRPWRHRQGAVRHGHLRLAHLGVDVGDRQGARQGRGQGEEDRRASARGRRGRHRHRERRAQGRRHRPQEDLHRGGARRLHRAQPAGRHGAGAEGEAPSTTRPTSPSRPGPISARSRSIPTPARPRSSSSSPATTSATSSTR